MYKRTISIQIKIPVIKLQPLPTMAILNYEALKNAFVEAGQYKINEISKFDANSKFKFMVSGNANYEYTIKDIQAFIPDCINIADKTLNFTNTMSDAQFKMGILLWGSKKDKKRPVDEATVYSCDVVELLANLNWINKEIGSIHKLNTGT